jgi:hypothetical protein
MAHLSLTVTYTFDTGLDGWTLTPGTNVTMSRITTDGDPGLGSIQSSLATKNNNRASVMTRDQTWESLGVPAAATVTTFQMNYRWRCTTYTSGGTANDVGPAELRNPGNNSVQATSSTALGFTATSAWAGRTGTAVAVPQAFAAATSNVRFALGNNLNTANVSGASVVALQDQIVITVEYFTAPQPPTISATAVSSSQIDLTMTAGLYATSHTLHRSTTTGFTPSAGNQIATFGATPTSPYEDIGLDADTTYYYVLVAVNEDGTANSTEASATTQAGAAPDQNLTATGFENTSLFGSVTVTDVNTLTATSLVNTSLLGSPVVSTAGNNPPFTPSITDVQIDIPDLGDVTLTASAYSDPDSDPSGGRRWRIYYQV